MLAISRFNEVRVGRDSCLNGLQTKVHSWFDANLLLLVRAVGIFRKFPVVFFDKFAVMGRKIFGELGHRSRPFLRGQIPPVFSRSLSFLVDVSFCRSTLQGAVLSW